MKSLETLVVELGFWMYSPIPMTNEKYDDYDDARKYGDENDGIYNDDNKHYLQQQM